MFPSHITFRRGNPRFTVLQLNTLGRFDEPLDLTLSRQKTLLDFINLSRPSIAALQEVPTSEGGLEGKALNLVDSLTAVSAAGACYSSVHYSKKTPRADMGCLLFDTRVFSLVSEECFSFGGESSQFAIIAILKLKASESSALGASEARNSTDGCVLVVAQHAKAGRTNANEAIRITHSQQLLSYLLDPSATQAARADGTDLSTSVSKFAADASPSALPTGAQLYPQLIRDGKLLWLGDMNAGPHSYADSGNAWPCEWYSRVVKGVSPADGGWYNASVPLLSAMTIAHKGSEPDFTTYKLRDGRMISQTIDYILLSRGSPCLILNGVSSPPDAFHDKALPVGGFPNEEWGSDHLPLLCEIEYRELPKPVAAPENRCWRD